MTAYVSVQTTGGPMWVFRCKDLDEAEVTMSRARSVQPDISVVLHTQRPVAGPKRRVYYLDASRLPAWFGGAER